MSKEKDHIFPIYGNYIVRQYDQLDNEWIDIIGPVTLVEAATKWDNLTNSGTQNTRYEDGLYFDVFPANTTMVFSDSFGEI